MAEKSFIRKFPSFIKDVKNSGFSTIAQPKGTRLLQKNGQFNVFKSGLTFSERFSLYHWITNVHLVAFLAVLLAAYFIINLAFASIYTYLGFEALAGIDPSHNLFAEAFYFSCQTFTTLGYGRVNPLSGSANLVSSLEAFLGIIWFALITGLVYGRFSRPHAKIIYSLNSIIAPYLTHKALMCRIANPKNSQIINIQAKMIFSIAETVDGNPKRMFYTLKLEIDQVSLLTTSWTIVHPIDESSPLNSLTEIDMQEGEAEILLMVQGYDETYAQEVHSRTSYTADEIVWNAKFYPILGKAINGKIMVELNKLSAFEKLNV